jgi:hypothetical protein
MRVIGECCDWCNSTKIERVGTEYSGHPILHCLDCGHEFYSHNQPFDPTTYLQDLIESVRKIIDGKTD